MKGVAATVSWYDASLWLFCPTDFYLNDEEKFPEMKNVSRAVSHPVLCTSPHPNQHMQKNVTFCKLTVKFLDDFGGFLPFADLKSKNSGKNQQREQ